MRYIPLPLSRPLSGRCIYRQKEYSFDFECASGLELCRRIGNAGVASLALDTLQIEFSLQHRELLYVWGYHSDAQWQKRKLPTPFSKIQSVRIEIGRTLAEGVGYRVENIDKWTTVYDETSGWLFFGNSEPGGDGDYCEFADNTIAVLMSDQMVALWLKPTFQHS